MVTATTGAIWNGQGDNKTKCHGSPTNRTERRKRLDEFLRARSTNLHNLPVYSSKEVALRNGQDGAPIWMSYGGYVYNVTDFIPLHPGGTERVSRAAGAAIEPFWYLHQQHSDTEKPLKILQSLVVGKLDASDQEQVDAQLDSLQQELDGFRLEVDLSMLGKGVRKLSLNDLMELPKTDIKSQVGCPQNQDRRPVSTSIFGGVRMKEILGQNSDQSVGQTIHFLAMDGEKVTVVVVNHDDILVCYEMDGAPLTKSRGFPLRVIIPGKRAVKWVQKIQVGGVK